MAQILEGMNGTDNSKLHALKHLEALNNTEKVELNDLRKQYKFLEKKRRELDSAPDGQDDHTESDEDDKDDYDDVDELPDHSKLKAKGSRSSVSAEAFGKWNKKEAFTPPVIQKTDETKQKIKDKLEGSFMFAALDPKDLQIVIMAMHEFKLSAGEHAITEGDDGDYLYVVESGVLKCTKIFPGNTEPTFLNDYVPGEAFGELALLYNAPRAATITAKEDAILWGLDRSTFNHIVKDSAVKRRQMYEDFLKKVPLLSNMETYERTKLADALIEKRYKKGDSIIQEGDEGSTFFLVEEGEAEAWKVIDGKPQCVMSYKMGDYFGERALLKNEPRAATIKATSDDFKVVELERGTFSRLLGPLDDILRRNMEVYAKFK